MGFLDAIMDFTAALTNVTSWVERTKRNLLQAMLQAAAICLGLAMLIVGVLILLVTYMPLPVFATTMIIMGLVILLFTIALR